MYSIQIYAYSLQEAIFVTTIEKPQKKNRSSTAGC
jgi:hypothetical protein